MLTVKDPTGIKAPTNQPVRAEPEEHDWLTTATAILRTQNMDRALLDEYLYYTPTQRPVKGFDPLENLPDDMQPYWSEAAEANSPEALELWTAKTRAAIANRKIAADASTGESVLWNGIAGFGSIVTLPLMLMPANMLIKSGASALKTAGVVAAGGATEASIQEVGLHSVDPTRTWQESLSIVGGTALFGAALGGLAGSLGKGRMNAINRIENENVRIITESDGLEKLIPEEIAGHAGAARVGESLEDLKARGTGGFWNKWSPTNRMLNSKSLTVRGVADRILAHNYFLGKQGKLKANTVKVETKINRIQGASMHTVYTTTRALHKELAEAGTKMRYHKFMERVGKAMVRGDIDPEFDQVSRAAATLRQKVIKPIEMQYKALGDLPEDLETKFAESYLPRLYDWEKINSDIPAWKTFLKDQYKARGMDADDAQLMADEVTDKLRNTNQGFMAREVKGSTGHLKDRGVDIEDTVLQDAGFLKTNVAEVMGGYTRSVVPEMVMKSEFGGLELKQNIDVIKKAYADTVQKLTDDFEAAKTNIPARNTAAVDELTENYETFIKVEQLKFNSNKAEIEGRLNWAIEDAIGKHELATLPAEMRLEKNLKTIRYEATVQRNKVFTQREDSIAALKRQYKQTTAAARSGWDQDIKAEYPEKRHILQTKKEADVRAIAKEREAAISKVRSGAKYDLTQIKTREQAELGRAKTAGKQEIYEAGKPTAKVIDKLKRAKAKELADAQKTKGKNQSTLRANRDKEVATFNKSADKEMRNAKAYRKAQKKKFKKGMKAATAKLEQGSNVHHLETEISHVRDEYGALMERATPKQAKRLLNQMESDIKDIKAIKDIILGRYGLPTNEAGRLTNASMAVRTSSFMASLGSMVVAAIPDIARPIMQHGITAWAKAMSPKLMPFMKSSKLAKADFEEMGIALDAILSTRAFAFADVSNHGGLHGKLQQGFATVSGMNRWNAYWKQVAAFTAQNRFLKDIRMYDSLSFRRKERLAKAGFDEAMVARIQSEEPNWSYIGASEHANTKQWTDREAANLFEHQLLQDVDNTIVTPGAGDRPLLMQSTELGKAIFQFKSFAFAAHNQVLIPLTQQLARGDMAAIEGLVAGLTLGLAARWAKLGLAGRLDELEDKSLADMMVEGMDGSGMFTFPMEMYMISNRILDGKLSDAMGLDEGTRKYNQNKLGSFLGPAAGYASDMWNVGMHRVNGDPVTTGDIRSMRRLVPGQNLFYARGLINKLEEQIADTFNLSDKRRREK